MHNANHPHLTKYTSAISHAFKTTKNKRAALAQTLSVLEDMSGDSILLTEIFKKHLLTPNSLSRKHYPVISMDISMTPCFGLVANCWIPLPDHETDLSTKSIHHHGDMLLNTVTAFGPGYEHWMFTRPHAIDSEGELYSMRVLERSRHTLHHVALVDSGVPHVPFYPAYSSITFALWTSQHTVTWRDRLKRLKILKGRERVLRQLAVRAGLKRALDLKIVQCFDFYPVNHAFKGIRQRTEFTLGPNSDYLHSLFHMIQQTGNESLATLIESQLTSTPLRDRSTAISLLWELKKGTPIEPRLSQNHYGMIEANFTTAQIELAVSLDGTPVSVWAQPNS
jgi:hypothetical protein